MSSVDPKIDFFSVVGDDVSPEAVSFLSQSLAAEWSMVDLSPSGVCDLRKENSQVAFPGCQRIVSECNVRVEEDIINGINVQWVIPENHPAERHRTNQRQEVIVFYLYGGGFVCGCPEDDLSITSRLATHLSLRVCVPRYRLSPEHHYPAAISDVTRVYLSVSKIFNVLLVGESAGGNLALSLLLSAMSSPLKKLDEEQNINAEREDERNASVASDHDKKDLFRVPLAVALLSPWIDLTHSGQSHRQLQLDPTLSVKHFLDPAAQAYSGAYSPNHGGISPLFADFPPPSSLWPPTTISTGTRDLLRSDAVRLASKIKTGFLADELESSNDIKLDGGQRNNDTNADTMSVFQNPKKDLNFVKEAECASDKAKSGSPIVDVRVAKEMWHVYEWSPEIPEAEVSLRYISEFLLKYSDL
tara:strand:- start:9 stop:1253 length:1245 start_codon:yes stop_codon:yes gene_type:complete